MTNLKQSKAVTYKVLVKYYQDGEWKNYSIDMATTSGIVSTIMYVLEHVNQWQNVSDVTLVDAYAI